MNYIHRFISGTDPILLLLHGTGGNENDLIPFAQKILPGATILSPRGKILENGHLRFFRRLAVGVFDEADLITRTHELADFVISSAKTYKFNKNNVIAVGFSNGANIAVSMLLLRPNILAGAILLRPMLPLVPSSLPNLSGKRVLMICGQNDPLIPPESAERLSELLHKAGAETNYQVIPADHGLSQIDIEIMKDWLNNYFSRLNTSF
jgi:predicted esterase